MVSINPSYYWEDREQDKQLSNFAPGKILPSVDTIGDLEEVVSADNSVAILVAS
jgi:hypothetical protein